MSRKKEVGSSTALDSDEENLYGHLDELKELIGGEESLAQEALAELEEDEGGDVDGQEYGEDMYDGGEDSLLAEFSDYGEVSEGDDEQDFMNAIREANNFKIKKKNRSSKSKAGASRPRRERVLDPEVAQLLSEANEAFVRNDLVVAEGLFNEVIKKDARNFAAYETLGDIYQLQGRLNDCCNSWFLAAHLNSSDWQFWKVVANLSAELGHVRQAIYCYSRVININHEDWESIYKRSSLYKDIGYIGRALEGFQKLYAHNPYDADILRELAVLYVEYNRITDAIGLYMQVFETNVNKRKAIMKEAENALASSSDEDEKADSAQKESYPDDSNEWQQMLQNDEDYQKYPDINWRKIQQDHKCIPFDWSSLNILAELYLKLSAKNNNGINTIKKCARWIERREIHTFWDALVDDCEFDDRRFQNSRFDSLPDVEKAKSYSLPIDIRVRLGLMRLNNDQTTEALNHFQFLYDENFEDTSDLYFEVAVALSKSEKYKEAIEFFVPLLSLEEYRILELFKPLARCYKEIEDYESAKEYYLKVIALEPDDLEDKLTLAEIYYHLGNTALFNKLLIEVVEARKKQTEKVLNITKEYTEGRSMVSDSPKPQKDVSEKPLLEDSLFRQSAFKKKRTPQDAERERLERERRITSKVMNKYKKLAIYKKGMELGDKVQTTMWIDTVSDLIDIFSSVKNFFVKSRSKKFVGIIRRSRKFNKIIDYKIERLSKLSEGKGLLDGLPVIEERVILTSTTELRGLSYDQWFELFMELSLVITKVQGVADGLSVIDTAQEVNVFFQSLERVKIMRFVKLAIVLQTEDENALTENLRILLNQFQFNRKVLQVFMFSVAKGQASLDILSSTVQQKFFLRQLKAYDSCRYHTHVNGQASITNKEVVNPAKKCSPYLYYIYAVLLYSSRGFLSALQYLNLLYREIPNDPMVNLLMALAHLHRSMQRLTPNRHFQIMHGLRYLYRYQDIRNSSSYTILERQEAEYNIGRAFHLLGLVSIAIEYYQKVLQDYEDVRLKRHAAYNSVLIYQESGNTKLANHIMETYLSV